MPERTHPAAFAHHHAIGTRRGGVRRPSGARRCVDLPPELDRSEITTLTASGEIEIHELDQWAAPLSKMARQTLTADLITRLPPGKVVVAPLDKPAGALGLNVVILEYNPESAGLKFAASWGSERRQVLGRRKPFDHVEGRRRRHPLRGRPARQRSAGADCGWRRDSTGGFLDTPEVTVSIGTISSRDAPHGQVHANRQGIHPGASQGGAACAHRGHLGAGARLSTGEEALRGAAASLRGGSCDAPTDSRICNPSSTSITRAPRCCATRRIFYALTREYLRKAHAQGVVHAEIFFDPQTHRARGVALSTILDGLGRACTEAERESGVTCLLILCFLRHLSADEAMRTLEEALPHKHRIAAIGLDSSECGHPPSKFAGGVRARPQRRPVSRGSCGRGRPRPPISPRPWTFFTCGRIDHGVRCEEAPELLERPGPRADATHDLPAVETSNSTCSIGFEDHNLKRLLKRGLCVTVNSDDPAYFGGYVLENYLAVREGLDLSHAELTTLARNSIEASFLADADKRRWLLAIDEYARSAGEDHSPDGTTGG